MLVAAGLMTGCGKDSEETPTKPEDPGDPIPPVTTTYEIGDYYENGFVKGIVIYIDSEGKSGTVVSLDETEAIWSYKYEEPMASFPQTGRYNTDFYHWVRKYICHWNFIAIMKSSWCFFRDLNALHLSFCNT